MHRKWYKVLCTAGCVIDGVRYSGATIESLPPKMRSKKFHRYLQECCNLHRGRDSTYLMNVFFKSLRKCKDLVRPLHRAPVTLYTARIHNLLMIDCIASFGLIVLLECINYIALTHICTCVSVVEHQRKLPSKEDV